MLRIFTAADRAHAALLGEELLELLLPHPVAAAQMVFPRPAVQPDLALLALLVVARLAVSAVATSPRPVTGKVIERFRLTTCRAAAVTIRNHRQLANLPTLLLLQTLGVARLGAHVEARLAIAAATIRPTGVRTELIERLPLIAVSATTMSVSII
ncbi:hypothetical protein ACFO0M_15790 [Micromonospora mangrovi]|uniref:Secreted protein n=2 Tax=Micromonospora TaxID=1873 RepID=A0AAU8HPS0_9ACTN